MNALGKKVKYDKTNNQGKDTESTEIKIWSNRWRRLKMANDCKEKGNDRAAIQAIGTDMCKMKIYLKGDLHKMKVQFQRDFKKELHDMRTKINQKLQYAINNLQPQTKGSMRWRF